MFMYPFTRKRSIGQQRIRSIAPSGPPAIEPLEGRRLLSVSVHSAHQGGAGGSSGHGDHGSGVDNNFGRSLSTILFSQAPTAVQTGLTTLATKAGLAAP